MDKNKISFCRQILYWRLLTNTFGYSDRAANFETMSREIVNKLNLPELLLDPNIGIDQLLQRYPELEKEFQATTLANISAEDEDPRSEITLKRALIFSKLLLNAFGPNTQTNIVSAQQYAQWLKDIGHLERALGTKPDGVCIGTGKGKNAEKTSKNLTPTNTEDVGAGTGEGSGFNISETELKAALKAMEGELLDRMALREVLKDDRLASQLTPSMALVEQLLRDKANLSGKALKNAKELIRKYVDELAEVLKLQVAQTSTGKIDRSVPPKKVFRNLDVNYPRFHRGLLIQQIAL